MVGDCAWGVYDVFCTALWQWPGYIGGKHGWAHSQTMFSLFLKGYGNNWQFIIVWERGWMYVQWDTVHRMRSHRLQPESGWTVTHVQGPGLESGDPCTVRLKFKEFEDVQEGVLVSNASWVTELQREETDWLSHDWNLYLSATSLAGGNNKHYLLPCRAGTDDVITNTLDTMDIYIMPILNVDGYVYSFEEVSKPLYN